MAPTLPGHARSKCMQPPDHGPAHSGCECRPAILNAEREPCLTQSVCVLGSDECQSRRVTGYASVLVATMCVVARVKGGLAAVWRLADFSSVFPSAFGEMRVLTQRDPFFFHVSRILPSYSQHIPFIVLHTGRTTGDAVDLARFGEACGVAQRPHPPSSSRLHQQQQRCGQRS